MKPLGPEPKVRRLRVWWALILCCAFSLPAAGADTLQPALDPLVRVFLNTPGVHSPGLQVGLVMPGKSSLYSWGFIDRHTAQTPRPEHIYEIASLSKPVTAILVADAAQRGELQLDAAIRSCQPTENSAWCYRGQALSWRDLLTHHGGLPALPDNLTPTLPQPIRQYTPAQLQDFLDSFQRTRPAGQHFAYSNLGYSLLGQALASTTGLRFDELVRQRFSAPLQLPDTRVYLQTGQRLRLLHGYIGHQPVPYIPDAGGLTPSGGINASARDLLRWLEALLDLRATPLRETLQLNLELTGRSGAPFCQLSLGWQYFEPRQWYWHSGSAAGFKVFMGFSRRYQLGVVILANARIQGFKMEPLGMQILELLESHPSQLRTKAEVP